MDYKALYFSLKASIEDRDYLAQAQSEDQREDMERELRETESRDPEYRYGDTSESDDYDDCDDDYDDCY